VKSQFWNERKYLQIIYLRGLVSRIYKELSKLNSKQTNNPVKKLGKLLEPRGHQRAYNERQTSTSLAIKKTPITTTAKYHYTPIRTSKMKNG